MMQKLVDAIRKAQRICLVSHVRPDGDSVGALVGLGLALKDRRKEVELVLKDGSPGMFSFIEGSGLIKTELPRDFDLYILLDLPDIARTGFLEEMRVIAQDKKLAGIDHHPKGDLAKLTQAFYHATASSTSELIANVIRELQIKISPGIATALLTGMYTDTGGFQYMTTSVDTFEHAAELMRRGGKLKQIVQQVSHHKSVASLKLLGLALDRARIDTKRRRAVSYLDLADIANVKGEIDDTSGIANTLCTLEEIDYAEFFLEIEPGIVRVSLRTADTSKFDVSLLAKEKGGGGHPRASGYIVSGHITDDTVHGWRVEPNMVS